jgi:hypothetical protein
VCDENLLAGMKMFREMLTFRETSRKILDINVSAALEDGWGWRAGLFIIFSFLGGVGFYLQFYSLQSYHK